MTTTTALPDFEARVAAAQTDEQVCRLFAEQHPTPEVLRAIRYAESARISWSDLERLFARALAAGLEAVR